MELYKEGHPGFGNDAEVVRRYHREDASYKQQVEYLMGVVQVNLKIYETHVQELEGRAKELTDFNASLVGKLTRLRAKFRELLEEI